MHKLGRLLDHPSNVPVAPNLPGQVPLRLCKQVQNRRVACAFTTPPGPRHRKKGEPHVALGRRRAACRGPTVDGLNP